MGDNILFQQHAGLIKAERLLPISREVETEARCARVLR